MNRAGPRGVLPQYRGMKPVNPFPQRGCRNPAWRTVNEEADFWLPEVALVWSQGRAGG